MLKEALQAKRKWYWIKTQTLRKKCKTLEIANIWVNIKYYFFLLISVIYMTFKWIYVDLIHMTTIT